MAGDLLRDMAAQLIDLKSRVAHLIRELDSLRDTGQNALLHFERLSKQLQMGLQVTSHEIEKATKSLNGAELRLANTRDALTLLGKKREERREQHKVEMMRMEALLKRMADDHEKHLEGMEQRGYDRILEMRRDMDELVRRGVEHQELDLVSAPTVGLGRGCCRDSDGRPLL